MADRGRDTSYELTQVRTVLSRAETAISKIEAQPDCWLVQQGLETVDPDREQMMTALAGVVSLLGQWARTGRSKD